MHLSDFISQHVEDILVEWEAFARSIPVASGLDQKALRNDARYILLTIAQDMKTAQSAAQQKTKSEGGRPNTRTEDSAAESHGAARFADGFNWNEMASEYRALRASVLRLWEKYCQSHDQPPSLYEITRFNEGIDEALAESVARFAQRVDQAREIFMGAFGHDLRTPLQVILSACRTVRKSAVDDQLASVGLIERSALQMGDMVRDLLDVARTRLVGSFSLEPMPMDCKELCEQVIEEFKTLHPQRALKLSVSGNASGIWDRARLQQVLTNLLRNAFQHGTRDSEVTLRVTSSDDAVDFEVHNFGEPIPPTLLPRLFQPLFQGTSPGHAQEGSMGLGLFIVSEIVKEHRGSIAVTSDAQAGTTFRVHLPRSAESLSSRNPRHRDSASNRPRVAHDLTAFTKA